MISNRRVEMYNANAQDSPESDEEAIFREDLVDFPRFSRTGARTDISIFRQFSEICSSEGFHPLGYCPPALSKLMRDWVRPRWISACMAPPRSPEA